MTTKKEHFPGDFIQVSKDKQTKDRYIEQRKALDLSKLPKVKVLVQGHCTKTLCTLNEVFQYITDPNINIKEQVEEYTGRSTHKRKSWFQQAQDKKRAMK